MYTERWMDVPENNVKGYDSSSLLVGNRVARLKEYDGRFMLFHGTFDDNGNF